MKLFGIWTLFVALSISAVAAYYSIVGLTAIFAAAVVPVIIMATVLEIGKINTAVLLHLNWRTLPGIMRVYLTFATVVLMFITSMGIFGFLSSAHIEQTAVGQEQSAQLTRIEDDIARLERDNEQAREDIARLENADGEEFERLQQRIDQAAAQVDRELELVQPDIEQQQEIIADREERIQAQIDDLQAQMESIREEEDELDNVLEELISRDFISRSQAIRQEQQPERQRLNEQRQRLQANINELRSDSDPVIAEAREEISRLRERARERAATAQETVDQLRARISSNSNETNTEAEIQALENDIAQRREAIRELEDEQFNIESKIRQLEAEVGPVRYVAELIYGNNNESTIEDAVRWIIIILVAVFDPFAIVLVIGGVWMITKSKRPSGIDVEETGTNDLGRKIETDEQATTDDSKKNQN